MQKGKEPDDEKVTLQVKPDPVHKGWFTVTGIKKQGVIIRKK